MPNHIVSPTIIQAAGNKPKKIEEFVGRVNSATEDLSIARMTSPGGWVEPGQTPEFDEFTVVLRGTLHIDYQGGELDVYAGQAVIAQSRRMGEIQHSGSGRGRVFRRLPSRVFAPDGSPGRVSSQAVLSGQRPLGARHARHPRIAFHRHSQGAGGGFEDRFADVVAVAAVVNEDVQIAERVGGKGLQEVFDQLAVEVADLRTVQTER